MSLSFLKSVLIPVSYSGYVLLQKIYPPLAGLISFPDLFIQENPCPPAAQNEVFPYPIYTMFYLSHVSTLHKENSAKKSFSPLNAE